MTNTETAQAPTTRPTCDGDHWMRTRDGRVLWCLASECIVHGSGMQA